VNEKEIQSRSTALLGEEAMRKLASAHVLIVGVGGVGSWCAETLARTGIGNLTLIDDDIVVESNLNRQLQAARSTIGRLKVEALAERLRDVAPNCNVIAQPRRWISEKIEGYDLIIDAIDSVANKAELILKSLAAKIPVISSMGAAFRYDPLKITYSSFDKVCGDGLARALREKFKKLNIRPARFYAVWSKEPKSQSQTEEVKGSLMQVTATFGMILASKAIERLTK
jgi:tRNA A37 threonylcarbamoyladenosine dehydratase